MVVIIDYNVGNLKSVQNAFERIGVETIVSRDHAVIRQAKGIVLGQCLKNALGDKRGITRYGQMTIPMDEALVTTTLDLSGRPYLVYQVTLPMLVLGNYETEMTKEFFKAVSDQALITLHIHEAYGENTHHIIEAIFKSFARALKTAVMIDEKNKDMVISSKGLL